MKKCIALLLTLILLCGCTAGTPQAEATLFAMDTVMTLKIWGTDGEEAVQQIKNLLSDLETTWSVTQEDSLLSAINRGEGAPDARQQALLDTALEMEELTGGAFDPQLHSIIALWGFQTGEYRVPEAWELAQAAEDRQWDLGAILKGYAGEQAVERLKALEVDRAILSLGGNIQTYGEKADGSPWNIAIENPDGGEAVGQVAVQGTMAVVSSGNYQRYFELDGKCYHHIIDPSTGCPADSGLRSVTVICESGTRADALSTALFVMGLEKGGVFWRQQGNFEAVFILEDGSVYATAGAAFSGCEFEVIGK